MDLLTFVDKVNHLMDEGIEENDVDVAYLDFAKALIVLHQRLLVKLHKYRTGEQVLSWVTMVEEQTSKGLAYMDGSQFGGKWSQKYHNG